MYVWVVSLQTKTVCAGFIDMPVMNFFDHCKLVFKGGKYYAEICEANHFFQ